MLQFAWLPSSFQKINAVGKACSNIFTIRGAYERLQQELWRRQRAAEARKSEDNEHGSP